MPGFVLGFVAMAVVRSVGDAMLASGGAAFGSGTRLPGQRHQAARRYWASQMLLGTAMAAVGLNTSFAVFKGVGLKPFAVGMAGALVVGVGRHADGRDLRPLYSSLTSDDLVRRVRPLPRGPNVVR